MVNPATQQLYSNTATQCEVKMAAIISLLNQKGGVDKTTLAVHLSTSLVKRGLRVMLVDADQQISALDWSALRDDKESFPVVGMPKPIYREVKP